MKNNIFLIIPISSASGTMLYGAGRGFQPIAHDPKDNTAGSSMPHTKIDDLLEEMSRVHQNRPSFSTTAQTWRTQYVRTTPKDTPTIFSRDESPLIDPLNDTAYAKKDHIATKDQDITLADSIIEYTTEQSTHTPAHTGSVVHQNAAKQRFENISNLQNHPIIRSTAMERIKQPFKKLYTKVKKPSTLTSTTPVDTMEDKLSGPKVHDTRFHIDKQNGTSKITTARDALLATRSDLRNEYQKLSQLNKENLIRQEDINSFADNVESIFKRAAFVKDGTEKTDIKDDVQKLNDNLSIIRNTYNLQIDDETIPPKTVIENAQKLQHIILEHLEYAQNLLAMTDLTILALRLKDPEHENRQIQRQIDALIERCQNIHTIINGPMVMPDTPQVSLQSLLKSTNTKIPSHLQRNQIAIQTKLNRSLATLQKIGSKVSIKHMLITIAIVTTLSLILVDLLTGDIT